MITSLITAFLLGLIGGAIPGPINTAIFTEILQSGLLKSFRIIFIGFITETIIALFCFAILASLHVANYVFGFIYLVGAVMLFWISTMIWKIKRIDTKAKIHFSVWKIAAMILANGGLWVFLITVDSPRAIGLGQQVRFGAILFWITNEIGWFISTSAVAFIFSRFRKWLSQPHIVPIVFKIFSLVFVYFAINSIYQGVILFLK